MGRVLDKPGDLLGVLALAAIALWAISIPFLGEPKIPSGVEIPEDFIGEVWRLSAAARADIAPEYLVLDKSMTEVAVKRTSRIFAVNDLIDCTRGSTVVVLCHPEGLLVCQYGPYIFVVDDRDLIIHLATLESWKSDGLYPCRQPCPTQEPPPE